MTFRNSIHSIIFLALLFLTGRPGLKAQEASRCARIVSGIDTITSSVFYFTRSAELRLLAPSEGTALYYTMDGSEPQRSSPLYSRPLLFSAPAILNYLSIESGRKETRCPSLLLRRIEGIESITLSAGTYSLRNGPALALFDTLQAAPLTIPCNNTHATLLINRGIVTTADSIHLVFSQENLNQIKKIDFFLSADGKSFVRAAKSRIKGSEIRRQNWFTLPGRSVAFRYLKIELYFKKDHSSEMRIIPVKAIKIYNNQAK